MRVLLLCDDYWHPMEVPIGGIKPLEAKGYTFDIISDANNFNPDMLGGYPVVMLCKSNQKSQKNKNGWITDAIEQAFVRYVENGGGLLVIHSGTVLDNSTSILSKLIGCRFAFHPNACPVMVSPIMPHQITEGVSAFYEVDEHYRLEIIADDLMPIMASYSAAQDFDDKHEEDPYHNTSAWIGAAGLIRTQGKGRVCILTPGHLLPVWLNGEFQRILENAIKWVGVNYSLE